MNDEEDTRAKEKLGALPIEAILVAMFDALITCARVLGFVLRGLRYDAFHLTHLFSCCATMMLPRFYAQQQRAVLYTVLIIVIGLLIPDCLALYLELSNSATWLHYDALFSVSFVIIDIFYLYILPKYIELTAPSKID